MTTKEIITLQFGHYSNFVGTHWWNIQESSFVYPGSGILSEEKGADSDILFREGTTLQGEVTYTPRLIAVDLKGSLNVLKRDGTLYDAGTEEEVKWPGDVTLHKADPPPRNDFLEDLVEEERGECSAEDKFDNFSANSVSSVTRVGGDRPKEDGIFGPKFYNLDDSVKVWSDFLKIHLHPNTLSIVREYLHDNELAPFNVFGQGASLMVANSDFQEEWENKIHFFTEECDQLQGFHILLDQHNGFGGLGWRALTFLEDEFANKVKLTFASTPAVCPDSTPAERACRILSSTLCMERCSALSSLYVPLSLASSLWRNMGEPRSAPHLAFKAGLPYHSSAILAASLDTATMAYRGCGAPCHIWDIAGALSPMGRKMAALSTSLPFPLPDTGRFVDSLMGLGDQPPWFSLTPHTSGTAAPYVQNVVTRGIPPSRVKSLNPGSVPHLSSGCNTVDDVLQVYFPDIFPNTQSVSMVFNSPCKVVTPFPHIFHKLVSRSGFLTQTERPALQGVESVPMMTSLQSTPEMKTLLSSLHDAAAKFNIRRHPRFLEHSLEEDEFTETVQNLQTLVDCYSLVA